MARVDEHGKFFGYKLIIIINYDKFYDEGKEISKEYTEYTSHNTERLSALNKKLYNLIY